ncbi:MAG: hypothetical protein JNM06_03865, partial [Blastocatellia bacterium]|nr:hypothetical protein [Blastocatellia bacterium]
IVEKVGSKPEIEPTKVLSQITQVRAEIAIVNQKEQTDLIAALNNFATAS